MKSWTVPLLVAVGIVAALFFLSSTGKQPPMIPGDVAHQSVITEKGCATCHAPGQASPLDRDHPPKEQCLICHKRSRG